MSIEQINDFFSNNEEPHKQLCRLIQDCGLTTYRIEKESTVNRSIITALKKSADITITNDTAVKLATFFKLDVNQFALKCAWDRIEHTKCNLEDISPFDKFVKYFCCDEICDGCTQKFTSYYSGKHPVYGDHFESECPNCGAVNQSLKTLTQVSEIESNWVKAELKKQKKEK